MNQVQKFNVRRTLEAPLKEHGWAVSFHPEYLDSAPPLHILDVILVSFILDGEVSHVIGDEQFIQKAGSIAITYYGQPHAMKTDSEPINNFNIYLDPEEYPFPRLEGKLSEVMRQLFPSHSGFTHSRNRVLSCQLNDPKSIKHLLEKSFQEFKNPSLGSTQSLALYKELFLIECCRSALNQGITSPLAHQNQSPIWFDKLLQYLDDNYREQINLEELSAVVGVSSSYLCRIFKKEMGHTIFEYLIHRRLQFAYHELRTSSKKVLAIALESGFGDLTYFNRVFKKHAGCSPREYRCKFRRSN